MKYKKKIRSRLTLMVLLFICCFFISSCSGKTNGKSQSENSDVNLSSSNKEEALNKGLDNNSAGKKKVIYTSFFPIKNITETIAGEYFEIRSFMPEDKEAHHWEPSAKDVKELSHSELFIVNGANLEFWLPDIKGSLPELKILDLSDGLDLLTSEGAAGKGEFSYMASYDFKKGKYAMVFGHTHEKMMRAAFLKDGKGKEDEGKKIMEKEGEMADQESTVIVKSGEVYNMKMGHESGVIYFEIPEEGNYTLFTDRVTSDILPWSLSDSNGNEIKLTEEVLKEKPSVNTATDPHSFISLTNSKIYAERIYRELSEIDPSHKVEMKKNRDKFIEGITKLEEEYKEKLSSVKNREFVVPHQAFGYLSREFNLKQFPLQGMTSMEDPDLKTISEAVNFCKEKGIKTIFYELGGSTKAAEAIAKEISGNIAPLSTMEFISPEFKEKNLNYTEVMEMNLKNIYEALK